MKLNVLERILLGNMLSKCESDFTTLRLVRQVRETLSFSDREAKMLNFIPDGKTLNWNPAADLEIGEVEILISDTVAGIIKKMLTDLNDAAKLTEQFFSLYEKFIANEIV